MSLLPPSTGQTVLLWDWMACSSIVGDTGYSTGAQLGMPIVTAPNSPYAAGSTPIYRGTLVDPYGAGIPAADLSSLTLTIADVLTGDVINGVSQVNILNTGRGTIDSSGNLQVSLLAADTSMDEVPGSLQVERALVIDWTYATSGPAATSGSGRHQVNFTLVALSGP